MDPPAQGIIINAMKYYTGAEEIPPDELIANLTGLLPEVGDYRSLLRVRRLALGKNSAQCMVVNLCSWAEIDHLASHSWEVAPAAPCRTFLPNCQR